jgi:predicted O-methyltransferase YrrM
MTEYQFTKDWFGWAPPVWEQLVPMLPGKPGNRTFLEIGSFEGRSTVWIVENMMQDGDHLDCVDTWEGGEEHSTEDMDAVWNRFQSNIELAMGKFDRKRFVLPWKTDSLSYLGAAIGEGNQRPYDFIYIDGSHIAKDVLTDACMAWPLLEPKGIMVFDDYMWGDPRDILHRPKPAIDAFTNIFAEEVDIVHVGYQLVVRKKGE